MYYKLKPSFFAKDIFMSRSEPLILLLDLDGTIQGNVWPQALEYETIETISNVTNTRLKYNESLLYQDLTNGLLRPYFKESILQIKNRHRNVEFFIYTASSDEWAHFLLPKILNHCFGRNNAVVINRPFFTRKHCMPNGKKRIATVKPEIVASLKNKYPNAKFNNIFMVDNNPVLFGQESQNLILCPTYDKVVLLCPIRTFAKDTITRYFPLLEQIMFKTQNSRNVSEFMNIYYKEMLKHYIFVSAYNKQYDNDDYWMKFRNVFMVKSQITTKNDVDYVIKKLKGIPFEYQ